MKTTIYNIDWNKIYNFETKHSILNKSWIASFFNNKKMGVKCMYDFYTAIGVDFNKINPRENDKVRRLRPHEIRANSKTIAKISEYIHSQYHPTKYKGRQPSAIGMDLLNYLPYEDNSVLDDTIVIKIDKDIKWDADIDYKENLDLE